MHHQSLLEFRLADPPQIWLILFLDPQDPAVDAPWANRMLSRALTLLRPRFRHVLAVSPTSSGGWLICNPGSCHLGLGVGTSHDVLDPLIQGVANGHIHCVAVTARRTATIRLRGLFTCVNVIAHLVGIDCYPFATPHGFYRRIAAMRR